MKEIYFKGSKIFEFKDENAIQIIGKDIQLITLIVEVYDKIFNGYKFLDIDIEAMNGNYPEVIKDDNSLKKKDMLLIRLSNMQDIIDQLTTKKNSILMKNISYFKDDILISKCMVELEERLTELSILIDELLEEKIGLEEVSIKSDIANINFDTVIKSFIDVNFVRDNDNRIPSWLLNEKESIELFISLVKLIIQSGEEITIIVDRIDSKMGINNYRILLDSLYKLTEENFNFKIWIIPSIEEGVYLDYKIFKNTYILNNEIRKFGEFDTTYESICRNYPDNNIPSKEEVLKSLLHILPFHKPKQLYDLSKEVIIMSIFLKLLGEDDTIRLKNVELSRLEKNLLTNLA